MPDALAVEIRNLMLYLDGQLHAYRCPNCHANVFHRVPPQIVAQAQKQSAATQVAYECNGCGAWYWADKETDI